MDVVVAVPGVVAVAAVARDVGDVRVGDVPASVRQVDPHRDAVGFRLAEPDDRVRLPPAANVAKSDLVSEPQLRRGHLDRA